MLLDPTDPRGQLDLIAAANLPSFTNAQNAELFTVKAGISSTRMNDLEAANKAYCTALMLQEDNAGAWEGWADLCQRMTAVRDGGGDGESSPKQWAVAAMVCLLNALRSHTEEEPQRRLVTRALLLLSLDADTVGPTFNTLSEQLDPMYVES